MRSYVESERYEAEQGARYDEKIETAKRLLQMKKLSYGDVAIGSGLTVEEIEELANNLLLV